MVKKDKIQYWAAQHPVMIAFLILAVLIAVAVVFGLSAIEDPQPVEVQPL